MSLRRRPLASYSSPSSLSGHPLFHIQSFPLYLILYCFPFSPRAMSLFFYRRLVVVLSFLSVFPLINAFSFSFATPSECGDLALTWTGKKKATFMFLFLILFSMSRRDSSFSIESHSRAFPCRRKHLSSLNILQVFGTPRNISIPSSAFNNGQGLYSFPLPYTAKSEIVIAMSDATGFATGGATNVLTVQPSKGGSCTTTPPSQS